MLPELLGELVVVEALVPTYEPVFSADGPVMGFDVLFPAAGDTGMRRVRVPLEAVSAHLAAAHRKSLDAAAASE